MTLVRLLRITLSRPFYFAILVPADAGSMGDQAMVQAIITYLQDQKKLKPRLYHVSSVDDWGPNMQGIAGFNATSVTDYPYLAVVSQISFLWSLRNVAEFGVIGADLMDGAYSEKAVLARLRLLGMVDKAGVPARLLGFSFYKVTTDNIVQAYRRLSPTIKFFARDPISQARFKEITGRHASLVADLAFLLVPAVISQPAKDASHWLDVQKNSGKRIVAINANQLFTEQGWGDVNQAYVHCITALADHDPNIRFLMIPHDYRQGIDDLQCLQNIHAQLAPDLQARCYIMADPIAAAEIKALLGKTELLVSGRMHAAIAALGQRVPVVCIVYVGKFEGLMQHVGLSDNLVTIDEAVNSNKLTEVALHCYQNRVAHKAQLESNIPRVLEMAKQNFM